MALREPHWSHILTTEALVSDIIRELHDCRVPKNRKPHLTAYPLTKSGSALEQVLCPDQTAKSSWSGHRSAQWLLSPSSLAQFFDPLCCPSAMITQQNTPKADTMRSS